MQLELESGVVPGPIDDRAIESTLALLGSDTGSPSFAILSKTAEDQDNYVQARVEGNGFVVEKREGHARAHFTARRLKSPAAPQRERKWWQLWKAAPEHDNFTLAETTEIFRSYMEGSEPTFWKWTPLEFPG
jgi:hypothetical protein